MKIVKTAIAATILGLATSAQADVLTFDAQPESYFVNNIYEGGYNFETSADGLGANNSNLFPSNGTTHLSSWSNNTSTSGFNLTNTITGNFDVDSFDFVGGYSDGYLEETVTSLTVSGWNAGTMVSSITFNAGVDFNNYTTYTTLDISFSNIDKLTVVANGLENRAHYDNFVVMPSAIPEPATFALMFGGLGLVGLMAARRRKQA